LEPINNNILQTLDESPFASLRKLSKRILIPMTTVRYHLVNKIGYKLKHCKWIPHKPSATQKQTRVIASARVLDMLRSVQHQGWKYVVTFDEAWFHFSNQHEQIWLPEEENAPTIAQHMTSSHKTMLTVGVEST
jgi:hypothetical protein